MALPTLGGGQQIGNGSPETELHVQATPVAKTAAAVLTAAEIAGGLISYNGAAVNLQLPTVADLEAYLTMARVDNVFDFWVIDLGGAGRGTITTNTGWTLVGTMASLSGLGVQFRARKTGPTSPGGSSTWTLYRLA